MEQEVETHTLLSLKLVRIQIDLSFHIQYLIFFVQHRPEQQEARTDKYTHTHAQKREHYFCCITTKKHRILLLRVYTIMINNYR